MGLFQGLLSVVGIMSADYYRIEDVRDETTVGDDGISPIKRSTFTTPKFTLSADFVDKTVRLETNNGFLSDGRGEQKTESQKGPFDVTVPMQIAEFKLEPEVKGSTYLASHQEYTPVYGANGAVYPGSRTEYDGYQSYSTKTSKLTINLTAQLSTPDTVTDEHGMREGKFTVHPKIVQGKWIIGKRVYASPYGAFSASVAEKLDAFIKLIYEEARRLYEAKIQELYATGRASMDEQMKEATKTAAAEAKQLLAYTTLARDPKINFEYFPLTGKVYSLIAIDSVRNALIYTYDRLSEQSNTWEGPLEGAVASIEESIRGDNFLAVNHSVCHWNEDQAGPVSAWLMYGDPEEKLEEWAALINGKTSA